MVTTGIVGATGLAYMAANQVSANMADEGLHPPAYPWYHKEPLHTFDHAAYVYDWIFWFEIRLSYVF